MPDLASLILRRSVGSFESHGRNCSGCRRTPVPGELLHIFEAERALCSLCLGRLPAAERTPLRAERVHASERHLAVVPRAA